MVADFETNYAEVTDTAGVWSACLKLKGYEPMIFRTIQQFMKCLLGIGSGTVYFHNLKFDGHFILDYLARSKQFRHAWDGERFLKAKSMNPGDFKYLISDRGVWYSITIKTKSGFIHIHDSMKRVPMSLKAAGLAYNTKHQKLEMDFTKWMDSSSPLSPEQESYIKNDVYVMEEFLESFEAEGHTKMTIGSCALAEFKKMYGPYRFRQDFPDIYADRPEGKTFSIGEFVLNSYHGAFVYVNPYRQGDTIKNGWTLDVNSIYAYVQHSMSGCRYPYGHGYYWEGKKPMELAHAVKDPIDFLHFKCKFRVREGKLPFVHIKNSAMYPASRVLETSDFWVNGEWHGSVEGTDSLCEFTMNHIEFQMFLEHYHVWELSIIDGVTFHTKLGIFDTYIDHFMEIKKNSTGGRRAIAKGFLVNLYGKFAAKQDSSFKVLDGFKDGHIKFRNIEAYDKKPGYIPIGSMVTSYAMMYTVRHTQMCYNKAGEGFCYSDTDSIHGDGKIPEGFRLHKSDLGAWDLELEWEEAIFVRAKTYLERSGENLKITCAGMPKRCKDLFAYSCGLGEPVKFRGPRELGFLLGKRHITDFKVGLKVPGKLQPKVVAGGVYLAERDFTMKKEMPYGQVYGKRGTHGRN